MNPGKLRDQLSALQQEILQVERTLDTMVSRGVSQLVEVRQEITESCEALERAVEKLDENYKHLL